MSIELKKMIFRGSIYIVTGLLCIGCGHKEQYGKFSEEQMQQIELANKYDLPEASGDSMVMGVFTETISSDEIMGITERFLKPMAAQTDEYSFREQARPLIQQAIRGMITDILLYQEAKKSAPESVDEMLEKAVEQEVNRFVASYGNNYALAESKIRDMGMDWRAFREYQKKLIMTQSYLSSKIESEKRFSNQQLMDFYTAHKNELFCKESEVGFSIINIQPEFLTAEQIDQDQTPQAAAERIAAELTEELNTPDADFSELAKQFHGDLAAIGGTITPVTRGIGALSEPYNSLEAYAVEMEPGQVQGPINLDGQLFVLKLDTLTEGGCDPFDKVKLRIEQQLLFMYRQEQYQELVTNLDSKANFAKMDRFTDFCVRQAYRRWGNS